MVLAVFLYDLCIYLNSNRNLASPGILLGQIGILIWPRQIPDLANVWPDSGSGYTMFSPNEAVVRFARKLLCFTNDLDTKHQRLF